MARASDLELIFHGVVLALAAIAAFTDVRKGEIPNWLTLPVIGIAPIAHAWLGGTNALISSVLGLLVCAIVPLLIFFREGMAGGDVKIFAAIGAAGGVYLGLEVQFLSLVAASLYAVDQLAWNGKLARSLANSVFIGLNPVLPRRYRRAIPRELMHRIRLGAAILLGAIIALSGHHRGVWQVLT